MQIAELIRYFSEIQSRLTAFLPQNPRLFFGDINLHQKRSALVIGPRGVGKTTLLLSSAKRSNLLYVSVDHPLISNVSLTDLAESAIREGFNGLAFDEIHHALNWSQHVKSLYDSHPKMQIWISDSSSLVLRLAAADLSRRFPKMNIPFLSFREYIHLKNGIEIPKIDPMKLDPNTLQEVLSMCNVMTLFKGYKEEGFRPIFTEGDYNEKIQAIVEKSIFSDVPFFLPNIQENHLRLMKAVIGYLAVAPIPTINVDAMASQWSLGKEKLYDLLNIMEQIGLINIVRFKKDHKVHGKGAKIFFADPSFYHVLGGDIGNTREAIVTTLVRQIGQEFFASKDESKGDFEWNKKTIEIGGKHKSIKGSDYVIRDDVEYAQKNMIPLWALGMMY
jgi:predicted AAA+ superfamily ATPase